MAGRDLVARARAADLRVRVGRPRVQVARVRPTARWAVVAAGLVAAALLAYVVARETPLFAVQSVLVSGAPPGVAADVRAALAPVEGASLVALRPEAAAERVRAVPSVRSAWVDRAFPHTLSVVVVPERPLAVVRRDDRAWVIAESGRVMATTRPHGRPRLPRIRVLLERGPTPGETLSAPTARAALEALRRLPEWFPVRVLFAEAGEDGLLLMVEGWTQVRLGSATDLDAKLRATAAVLRAMTPDERAAARYLDASVPEHVVVEGNPELESEGLGFPDEVAAN